MKLLFQIVPNTMPHILEGPGLSTQQKVFHETPYPIPSFHYKHQYRSNLWESNNVPISAAKVTLLQAVSIPLYPLSTISINTGPIYENLTMSQFLLQKSHFYRRYPSPHLSCKRKRSMSNIKKPSSEARGLNKLVK